MRAMQDLMKGKRGLIMGVANDHSIAWGIARTLAAQGAELAFTFQGEALGKRVKPLAQSLNVELVLPCDVDIAREMGPAGFSGPRHRVLRQE
jgi:enoyl-[acyl-carrier protein] reductase I